MSDEKHAMPRQPSDDPQEDILEAEAHGQEPPQSDEGILSGRAGAYGHAGQEKKTPAHEREGEEEAKAR